MNDVPKRHVAGAARLADYPVCINYRYGALSRMERISMITDAERAADQQEQRELLDKQYRDAEEV